MKMKIYLAGGMQSGWQDELIDQFDNQFIFFNPAAHNLHNVDEYRTWDLHHVKECDILFGYMEANNPSGYGLALEVGYAKALNKTIILVDEKSSVDPAFSHMFKFVNSSSHVHYSNLQDGLDMLNSFLRGTH